MGNVVSLGRDPANFNVPLYRLQVLVDAAEEAALRRDSDTIFHCRKEWARRHTNAALEGLGEFELLRHRLFDALKDVSPLDYVSRYREIPRWIAAL